jgi:CMP-N,N'-diacetyllegionaminic acid synthase
MQKKNIIAIIPARGGSKGIPRKNIRLVAGKPLIFYTIKAAKNSKLIDRVLVSTEDIAEISKKYGAEIIARPKKIAGDHTPSIDVLKQGIEWLEKKENYKADIVVYLQCTDIFRPKGIIDRVIEKLLKNPNLDSVFAAQPTHKNFWKEEREKYKRITKQYKKVRQKKQPIFREDTGIVSAVWVKLIKKGERIGQKVDFVINKDPLSFIDIHDELDLWLAEKTILALKKDNFIKRYDLS